LQRVQLTVDRVRLAAGCLGQPLRRPSRRERYAARRRSGKRQPQLTASGHALGDDDRALIGIEPQDVDLELLPQSVLHVGRDDLRRRVAFDAADLTEGQQPVEAVDLDPQSPGAKPRTSARTERDPLRAASSARQLRDRAICLTRTCQEVSAEASSMLSARRPRAAG
jgi:hypothetical protein